MSDATHIGLVIESLFGRGDLPDRIVVLRDRWPCDRHGDEYYWDDIRRGYQCARGRDLIYLAAVVRDQWGSLFGPAEAEQSLKAG